MRALVLGANGMLGHRLCLQLKNRMEVWGTVRGNPQAHSRYGLVEPGRMVGHVSATDLESVRRALGATRPEAVINTIGIVKQREEAKAAIPSIQVNALFPHQLAELCREVSARLIHFSTDCVFSGVHGGRIEEDVPDPVDLYGRTKLLGELDQPNCLTLRTSIVGWELDHRAGLLEWFASQRGKTTRGFRLAIYSGLSTSAMSDLVAVILEDWPDLSGLYHVASEPIDKYELLLGLRDRLGWDDIRLKPDDTFRCDRSLVSKRLEQLTNWHAPGWDEMLSDLASEWPTYRLWRDADNES